MATSPLSEYKNLAKELKITESLELPNEFKSSFISEQIDQLKSIIWRNAVDSVSTKLASETVSDPDVRNKHLEKVNEYRATIRQMVARLNVLIELRDELGS